MDENNFEEVVGIFQGDLIFKAAVELAIDDLRKNPWVLEDIFRQLIENPILARKYGMKEIARAKEFIMSNDIPVYMRHRVDKQEFPCITISIGNSKEDDSQATLGDQSVCVEDYDPCDIGRPIKYLIDPFLPESYDKTTGIVEVSKDLNGYIYIGAGQILVDPKTGDGWIIREKAGIHGIKVDPGSALPKGKVAIVPQYPLYRARRERATSKETYNIGCHVKGDVSTLIFLHSVVKYALYRYREGLLEHNNFALSSLSSTDLIKNDAFGIENIYSRWITVSGLVEETWVKSPMRFIEAVEMIDNSANGELKQGLKVCTNEVTDGVQGECDPWIAIEEEEDE